MPTTCTLQTSDVWQQPIQEEEEDEEEEEEKDEEDGADFELTSSHDGEELTITPSPPTSPAMPQMSDPAPETTRDDVELLHATMSHEHKIKKR